MKLAKAATVWAFVASTALILPASADAAPYPAPSVKEVTAFVQGKVNAKVPSDKQPGERTDCDYVPSKAKQGYKITCYTFDKAGHQIAMTTMHFLEPEGSEATFVYVVYPSTPAPASTVTFIVTATGGDNASLTYGSGLQTIQKNDVTLPFSATVRNQGIAVMEAQTNSGSNNATITCEIKTPGQPLIKTTSSGPYAVAQCTN